MKDTCVVRVDGDEEGLVANFYDGSGIAELNMWPPMLSRKFQSEGVYSIRRVRKFSARAVHVIITGTGDGEEPVVPAVFDTGYGLCARFLRELGVSPPPEGKRKTLHLVVTKRRK